MPVVMGRNDIFGLAKETTYGTFVRPTSGILILPPSNFTPTKQRMDEASAFGVAEKKLSDFAFGVRNWTGRLRGKLSREGLGIMLKNALGAHADTAHAPFTTHEFTASPSTPASVSALLMHGKSGDAVGWEWQLSGGMVKTLRVIGEINKPMEFEAELAGGKWDKQAFGTAPTIPVPTSGQHWWAFNDGWSINVAGSAYAPRSFELVIENSLNDGLEDSYEIQTAAAAANDRVRMERGGNPGIIWKGVFRRLVQASAQIDKFVAGTTGSTTVQAGTENDTTNYFFLFQMASSIVTDYQLNDSNGLWEEVITVEGYQSAATDNKVQYKDKQTVT